MSTVPHGGSGEPAAVVSPSSAARSSVVTPIRQGGERFREVLQAAVEAGEVVVIADVDGPMNPLLDSLLNQHVVVKGTSKLLFFGDTFVELADGFRLYITTRQSNPLYSPEVQSKVTIVDFTVTAMGLEDQLLGVVIQHEQQALEEQMRALIVDVNVNTKALYNLDQLLLQRLGDAKGDLLENTELISVLADTKRKAISVTSKLSHAAETRASLNEKREVYRAIARRGSVLYFAIADLAAVNPMYQTSLQQVLALFQRALHTAEKSVLQRLRITNILTTVTKLMVTYVTWGLYERHKLCFKVIVLLKLLSASGRIPPETLFVLLRGGGAMPATAVARPRPPYLSQSVWDSVTALTTLMPSLFKTLPESLTRLDAMWKPWLQSHTPELQAAVDIEPILKETGEMAPYFKTILVRCMREDRVVPAMNELIRNMEALTTIPGDESALPPGWRVPMLGPTFVANDASPSLTTILGDMDPTTPALYLLSTGADPTEMIEAAARRSYHTLECVSIGDGQSAAAEAAVQEGFASGSWVLLQNCHLDLGLMDRVELLLRRLSSSPSALSPKAAPASDMSASFRLFLTAEPVPNFPPALLHRCIKVTNESPSGLQAGLARSYSTLVDQELLDRVDAPEWRKLVYCVCFLHTVLQERRKFGTLGWNVPYEFNTTDLQACLTFMERHLYSSVVSWPTLRYMISEVHYGGRVTDALDRQLLTAYTSAWIGPASVQPNFRFNQSYATDSDEFAYKNPDFAEMEQYRSYIASLPAVDSPEVFGLNPIADVAVLLQEGSGLLSSLCSTQAEKPLLSSADSEAIVHEFVDGVLAKLPPGFTIPEVTSLLERSGGLSRPLHAFLLQETQWLTSVIHCTRTSLRSLKQALLGNIAMAPSLSTLRSSIEVGEVPRAWQSSATGDDLSWQSDTLAAWIDGLLKRNKQLEQWVTSGQPMCFWLPGFSNPQGFLTAVRQEVCRGLASPKPALDDLITTLVVTDFQDADAVRMPAADGVYIHGLVLEGATWRPTERTLVECTTKLRVSFPVLLLSAATPWAARAKAPDLGSHGGYLAPCYKYPSRGRHFMFFVPIPSKDHLPEHWTRRGVALLAIG